MSKITEAIKKIANKGKPFKTSDIIKELNEQYSRQAVSAALRRMTEKKFLASEGSGRYTFYVLPQYLNTLIHPISKKLLNKSLEEHEVLSKLKDKHDSLKNLEDNVESILDYAFSEMLNNAIEHSKSKYIQLKIAKTRKNIAFDVRDYGIGVFNNIMKKRKLKSQTEAVQDLLKGKTTTAPKAHSGEGIFFTSKIADLFILESYGYKLTIDNKIEDVFLEETPHLKGTNVSFYLSINSSKHLNDIFEKYQTDPKNYAFDKTEVLIRLYTMGTIYVSRSQARRVVAGLEKFNKIILDFKGVPTVGQAFADEVFRVFQNNHPKIKIEPINMQKGVEFMVKRAINT